MGLLATGSCGGEVRDGVRHRPGFAVFQQLQRLLSTNALRTRADGCIVARCVRPRLLNAHSLQKSNRMPWLSSFLTCCNSCVVADGVRYHPSLAIFQQFQCALPAHALRTSTDSCIVARSVGPRLLSAHGL